MFDVSFLHPKTGTFVPGRVADDGGVLVQSASSEFYHQAKNKRLFTSPMAAAGAVLPIFSNTSQIFGIWNPQGSGVVANITEIAKTFVSTTGAAGGYVLAIVKNAGAAVATGGNVSAFTELEVYNALGTGIDGDGAKCKVCSAATVTAPVIWRHLGHNQLVLTAADATNAQWSSRFQFRGDVLVAPNTAVFLAGNIATLTTWACSITWAEEPV